MGRKRRLHGLTIKDGYMRHPFDLANHVETSGLVRGPYLATGHPHDRHTTAYYGIAPSVLVKLCELWRGTSPAAPPEDYSFIDLGAGMGRALLIAAEMPFREAVGVELNQTLAEIAERNIRAWRFRARWPSRARVPMRVVCRSVTEFEFPANPCVAFLFNPFGEPVLAELIRSVESQFAGRRGQFDLLYANDECADVLAANPRWARLWRGLVPLSEEDEAADKAILNHQPEGEYAWSTEEPCSIYRFTGSKAGSTVSARNA